MLTQKGQKQEGYHLGDGDLLPGPPPWRFMGGWLLQERFLGTLLVLASPVFAPALLFTSGINTALYPFRIPDPTGIVFSSVGLCLVD